MSEPNAGLPGGAHVPTQGRSSAPVTGALALVATLLALTACGSGATPTPGPTNTPGPAAAAAAPPSSAKGPEVNPSGDIPDNQAYVPYSSPDGLFTVSVPEGWSRQSQGGGVMFTDKLNSVDISSAPGAQAPTIQSAQAQDVPALQSSVPGYQAGKVSMVNRKAGSAVLITYGASSPPDQVTGKTRPDAVERYEFWHSGQLVTLTLSGPTGADNVDPWRKVTDSLRWLR